MSDIHVLLIEDNRTYAQTVGAMLARVSGVERALAGFHLTHVETLSEGLAVLAHGGVDVILLDLLLPDSEGLDGLMRLRATAPDVPVVVLTVLSNTDLAVEAVHVGAQDFLFKTDLHPNALARAIRYAIERQHLTGELQRRTAQLAASEQHLRTVIERSADGVIVLDRAGVVRFANPAAESLFGRSGTDLLGQPFGSPVVVSDKIELDVVRPDGSHAIVEMRVTDIEWGGEAALLVTLRDITDRKRAEEALRASEAKYRSIVEQATDGIAISDADGILVEWNAAMEKITGLQRAEVIGQPAWEVQTRLGADPGKETEAREQMRRSLQQAYQEVAALPPGHKVSSEREIVAADGRRRIVQTSLFPIRTEDGLLLGRVARDLTEQRAAEAEEKRLRDQLLHAQKMEAVGRLTAGVAHDFNNLLTAIIGFGDLLRMKMIAGDPLLEYVDRILAASHSAASLVQQLMAFSRQQVLQPQALDLNLIVRGMDSLLRRLIGEDIRLRVNLAAESARVKVDPTKLQQVIINLAVNARDAMPEGGELVIETGHVSVTDAADEQGVPPGEWVLLRMTDNGVGISPELLERVFEPFFTTKPQGKGTGLGLSTVYGIVAQSGGHVRLRSAPGHGATFSIYLPRCEQPAAQPADAAPGTTPTPAGSGTILLAEDNPAVRDFAVGVLRERGYHVLAAGCGQEALHLLGTYRDAIHLIISDMVMPDMNGPALVKRVLAAHPTARTLYISGYTPEDLAHRGGLATDTPFLQKPFTAIQIADAVRRVLGS